MEGSKYIYIEDINERNICYETFTITSNVNDASFKR